MTAEEAVKIWERDVAIPQLKELGYELGEKIRTDGDCISREAAIAAVSEGCQEWRGIFERCEEKLLSLPSTEQERRKGRWIRITQGAIPELYMCPFCHRTVESYGVEEILSIRYPYCHCGADMRGEIA